MKKLLLGFAILSLSFSSAAAQDDVFESGLPNSKQAMLVVDVSLEPIVKNPMLAPFMNPRELGGFGPPIDAEDYQSLQRVTVFVGAPNLRSGTADFVARVRVSDKEVMSKLATKMFGFGRKELPTREEDGWTVVDNRESWPDVIRYKDNVLEFGSSLYTFSPSRSLVSKQLATAFGDLDKESEVRVAFDAQVLSKLLDAIMSAEKAREDAVYQMIKWGEFVNEPSLALYGVNMLKELSTASLSMNTKSDTMAKLALVPVSGKEEIVKAKAQVLHDFLMFHVNLPIKTLQEKENPVAGILQKMANGIKLTTTGSSFELTLAKPKDLSKDFLAIVDKMKGSFSDRDNANRMKMLGLAAHNYHDTHRRFPYSKNPNEGDRFSDDLSWRVRVLPFCELYQEYDRMDLSKGWDAEANQAVIAKGKSTFVLSNGALVSSVKTDAATNSFRHILDGTSNTIMLIENRNAAMTPWTKPLDVTIDQAVKSVMKLAKGDFLWVAMYDGSVWKLRGPKDTKLTESDLRNLFNPRDGNVVRRGDWLEDPNPRLFDGIDRPRRTRVDSRFEKKVDFGDAAEEAADEIPAAAPPRLKEKAVDKAADKD